MRYNAALFFSRLAIVTQNVSHDALGYLNERGILSPENEAVILAHRVPLKLAHALYKLKKAQMLTLDNRYMLAQYLDPYPLEKLWLNLIKRPFKCEVQFSEINKSIVE